MLSSINDKLFDFLMKLPKKNIINCMEHALDHMQQYNGRNINECITFALGGDLEDPNNNGRYHYHIPTLAQAKRNTD